MNMNYHMEITLLSRDKGASPGSVLCYISGEKIHDNYSGKTYRHHRNDLVQCRVYLPPDAPKDLLDLQHLCDELNKAEKRKDARTGRQFICSLPNELVPGEWAKIVSEFIKENFVAHGRKTESTTSAPTLKFGAGLGLRYRTEPTNDAISKSVSATKA